MKPSPCQLPVPAFELPGRQYGPEKGSGLAKFVDSLELAW